LRDVRLLDPEDSHSPDALDAHPLVREWFGERLRQTNESAWKAAHGRLYEHLRDTTKEGDTPTLEDLAPLYQAIAHGCRAGRYQEARDKIYRDRICRRGPDGEIEFYASSKLGAFGSNLSAISWFFDKPYATPVATLTPAAQSWVLNEAATGLRAQGRSPSAEDIAKMKSEAEEQLKIAADYIETCGYHRRDEELAELQAVLRGEKKFADLPPGGGEPLLPARGEKVGMRGALPLA
jgi:hypothetical protein